MKNLNIMALAIALASHSFAVSVDFYDEQQNNPSATGIRLRINNDSDAPITNAKLRYYFHRPSLPYSVNGYYLANATVSSNNINDTLAYFEVDIPSIPVGYYPDMAGFSLALHDTNWTYWNKTLDYSYQASSSLTRNTKVVLLSGDNVIFGDAPNVQSVSETGKIKISGLKFSENSWIEVKNVGNSVAALSEFQLFNANNSAFSLGNDSLGVDEVLRICQNQAACGEAGKTLVNSVFGWDSVGEAILRKDSSMVSYVAWGEPGLHAAAAVNAGVWSDSLEYFPAESHVQQYNADFIKNTFFRLRPNKSGMDAGDWFSFTSNDDPAKANSVPLPIKTSANQPVIKQIPGDNNVLFSWLPVDGVNSYRVIVRNQNDNDVYNFETQNTSVVLSVAPGNYRWTVIGEEEFHTVYHEGSSREYLTINMNVVEANIDTSVYKQLHVHQIKARRDTYLLNPSYLKSIAWYSWDKPNLESNVIEPHEEFRCWAIAIEILNHFYGGNLTQDEIVFNAKFMPNEPHLSPFFKDAGGINVDSITGEPTGDVIETMKWALKTDTLNYMKGAPSYQIVKDAIDSNKLIYVSVPNHAMIIYGYVGNADNYAFYFAFEDNNGKISTSLSHDSTKQIIRYFIPKVTRDSVQMSDNRVHMDSDGDGITDFDEEERFLTNPYSADSDNDGIEDKREIYNYTSIAVAIAAKVKEDSRPSPYYSWISINGKESVNPIYEAYAGFREKGDVNDNKKFAERDFDDNGDGIEDGLLNGHVAEHQGIENMDVPKNYTIFGREFVAVNDNVKCYNTQNASNDYCNIASSDEDIFSYDISYSPVSIGAHAHVGNVDFCSREFNRIAYPNLREKILLRSHSTVHGDVNAFVVPRMKSEELLNVDKEQRELVMEEYLKKQNPLEFISKQNGTSVQGNINLLFGHSWKNDFIYLYSTDMPSIPETQIKVVQNGETYHLKDGDEFSTLTVQSGGTLIVEPGEMFVDKLLQIDANATIRFAEPGKGTVLHTNGQIIWHTYNSEPTSNAQYWINVAKGFKLAHHSSKKFYLEGMWAGTIYAPKAKVVLGQVTKTIYGRVLARDVVVHQFAKVYRVDFNPTDALQVSYAF